MDPITVEQVEEKIAAGGELTAAEQEFLMGVPSDEMEEAHAQETPVGEASPAPEGEDAPPVSGTAKPEDAQPPEANKTGDKGAAQSGEAAAEPKPEVKPPAESTTEVLARIEAELAKPDGAAENLKTPQERGLYHALKGERLKRQELQREVDTLKFERKKAEQEAKKDAKDPDDFLTVKEVEEREARLREDFARAQQANQSTLWCLQAQAEYPDVYDVLAAGEQQRIIEKNPHYQAVIQDALSTGKNVAKVVYELLISDKSFVHPKPVPAKTEQPAAEPKKADAEALKNAEKLQKNAEKPKTSGNVGGGVEVPDQITQEWAQNLTEDQYRALSEKQRAKVLEMFG